MYEIKRKSLAGKCGIPLEKDRRYVEVEFGRQLSAPSLVRFENSQSWHVESVFNRFEYGREFFGNLCEHYQVFVGDDIRDIWHESGRWFVRK